MKRNWEIINNFFQLIRKILSEFHLFVSQCVIFVNSKRDFVKRFMKLLACMQLN